jgi:magnesium-transporting ATPase (P-type)
LFGLADPARAEAIEAVARCRSAGIRVKMITGDHAGTARAVAGRLGLATDAVLTGGELDGVSDQNLGPQAAAVDVFARTSPEHKLRLVEALQAAGEVVAMTGDGVNDAPALKRADIGVAMGQKGTEAAKEAAEMVLADDNFATIANAVEEGRTVYDNLKKAILFILPTNGGEAAVIVAAVALGTLLPITPVQILWVNMITAVTLALALAFEPAERDVMARPPRRPDEPLLSRFLLWRIVLVSLILLLGTFGLFLYERAQGAGIEAARTVAVNALVMCEVVYLFNTRHLSRSALSLATVSGNRFALLAAASVVLLQLLFTYAWPMQALFATAAVDAAAWGRILLVAAAVFVLVELEKTLVRRQSR